MYSISFYKIVVILICIGTVYSLFQMYETFIDGHSGKMSFPNSRLRGVEQNLNSMNIANGWRNAYMSGGGNPLFEVYPRYRHKEIPVQTRGCNYPFIPEAPLPSVRGFFT